MTTVVSQLRCSLFRFYASLVKRHKLDMDGFVTSEAMDERHKNAMQDRVLFVERSAQALRFAADQRSRAPTAHRR